MNTKAIVWVIILAIIIVLVIVWLHRTPQTVVAPSTSTPVGTTPATNTSPAATTSPASEPAASSTPQATPSSSSGQTTTTADGLKITVTKEGTGPGITDGQTAEMLYTGTLADGSVFDSTASRGNQPFSFQLGAGMVIKGWDEGIVGMKVGEERTLVIPPALGYGANGYPPVIPPNATLTFQVTLVGIK